MVITDYFSGHNLALQHAVDADNPQAAEQLLNAGADPNARERQVNGTILEYAVAQQRNKVILVLLRQGADPALRDNANANAMTVAFKVWHNDQDPLKLLLAAGADPDTRDEGGEPLLSRFLIRKQSDAVDFLIQYHVDVNALTAGNYNPTKLAQG